MCAPPTRAVLIGAAPARDSYLNIARIIAAARACGAEAIHPGYGFLSENPAFAEACAEAGIVFVGPPPSAMRAMGSKATAKTLMERAGVPLLPGYHGEKQDPAFLADQATRIGFPVMIKAVSGGGGRGMRVVAAASEFAGALAAAQQEAASAFGDDRVLIERYLDASAPHRGAGLRRHPRQRRAPVRTRLLGAAAPPEGDRGSPRIRARR